MLDNERGSARHLLEAWLDFGASVEGRPECRELLYDPVTGLPTAPLLFPRMTSLLDERGELSVLCVSVVPYSRIEGAWEAGDAMVQHVAEVLDESSGTILRDADIVARLNARDAFLVVLSPPRTTPSLDPAARVVLAGRVEEAVRERLASLDQSSHSARFGCFVGAATVVRDAQAQNQHLVHEVIECALENSKARQSADAAERSARLRSILASEDVTTLVHPVFDLRTMDVVGYEALSRGPAGTEFERPDRLFEEAYGADLVLRLERLCRMKALEVAGCLPEGRLLFVNLEPRAAADPQLREIAVGSALASDIVIELDERDAFRDFPALRAAAEYVRALGFPVGVQNAGSGTGSLKVLSALCPAWLKLDINLVRGCDSNPVNTKLIEALVVAATECDAKVVAQGIETEAELRTLQELGVAYGQGMLLAEPAVGICEDGAPPGKGFGGELSA